MPAYHSTLNEVAAKVAGGEVCGCAILPIKTKLRGPAPPAPEDQPDIVDEILETFRANVLFTNFEIKGSADRVLVYGTLFVHLCLKRLEKCPTKSEGGRMLQQLAVDNFGIPGDAGFPLGGMVSNPKNTSEKDTIRGYFKQLREALAARLVDRVYGTDGLRSKWWMFFAKRKFMNKELLN